MQQVQTQGFDIGKKFKQYEWRPDEEEMIRALMAAAMNHHADSRSGLKQDILDTFRNIKLKYLRVS